MPIYEYVCEDCGQTFEELIQSVKLLDRVVCPVCKSRRVREKTPPVTDQKDRYRASGLSSCSRPRG